MTDPFSQFMAGGDLPASALAWLLDSFATPFLKAIGGKWQDGRERARWDDALRSYGQSILRHYGRLRVLGKTEDVPLGSVFTDVYILDQISARRRFDIREMMEKPTDRFDLPRQREERRNGMGLVNQGLSLYILGKPGAGKTTFLKNVAVRAISNQLGSPATRRLPLFVPLHEWANSRHDELLPFLIAQLDTHHFPDAEKFLEHLLEKGSGLLLFDGLDEVRQEGERRAGVATQLRNFTKKYDKNQFLITCRVAASEYAFQGLRDVEVADFTREQSLDYARKWFGDSTQKYESFAADLEKPENAGLAELCNVPLLLSLLCLYYDDAQSFPARRAELYEDALDALLRKWDSSRQIARDEIYRGLSHKRKQQMFAHIATPAFEKGQLYWTTKQLSGEISRYLSHIPGAPSVEEIDGEAILRAIEAQHGVFVERAHNIHSFSHLSFQEYFTARYIVENEARGMTKALIEKHLVDRRWREIILLTASLLDNAEFFVGVIQFAHASLIDDSWGDSYLRWIDGHVQKQPRDLPCPRSVLRIAYLILRIDLHIAEARLRLLQLNDEKDYNTDFLRAKLRAFLSCRRTLSEVASALTPETEKLFDLSFALALDVDIIRIDNADSDIVTTVDLARSRSLNTSNVLAMLIPHTREIASKITAKTAASFLIFYLWRISGILQTDHRLSNNRTALLNSMPEFRTLCHDLEANEVVANIFLVGLPKNAHDDTGWYSLERTLERTLSEYLQLTSFTSSNANETGQMQNYLYANELLIRCLDLAYVTNRQEILDNLLRPPRALTTPST